MIEGVTKSGFKFKVDKRAVTDQRMLDAIVRSMSKNADEQVKGSVEVYLLLLGEKQYKKLEEHIMKQNDGFCPADIMAAEYAEIMESAKELKN